VLFVAIRVGLITEELITDYFAFWCEFVSIRGFAASTSTQRLYKTLTVFPLAMRQISHEREQT
jgi:hypothetical protein